MHVFITGATGFIGTRVTKELLAHGHTVLGMARSDEGAAVLAGLGAKAHRGTLEDAESLRRGVAGADAVIHLGFNHDFSKFAENGQVDKRAIEAMGAVLAGSSRPLIVTSGVAGIAVGQPATEDMELPPKYFIPRVSEQTALSLVPQGVHASVMRLSQIHDPVKQGLVTYLVGVAREKKVSAYVGDGANRWAAAHVDDVARLYRLALEKHQPGAKYHAVDEEGVSLREIAEVIGKGLNLPVRSLPAAEAAGHFGFLGHFVSTDLMASSAKTRKTLGWTPDGPGLISDLNRMDYSKV